MYCWYRLREIFVVPIIRKKIFVIISFWRRISVRQILMQIVGEQNHQTFGNLVFLLDWDDTLCASTFGQRMLHGSNGSHEVAAWNGSQQAAAWNGSQQAAAWNGSQQAAAWRNLALFVKLLLQQMLMLAPDGVYIVTNSQTGWVELSVERWMPELKPLLPRLRIISARSSYATLAQEQAMKENRIVESDLVEWKYRAFLAILLRHRLAEVHQFAKQNHPHHHHQMQGHHHPLQKRAGLTAATLLRLLGTICGGARLHDRAAIEPLLEKDENDENNNHKNDLMIVALGDSFVELKAMEKACAMLQIPTTKWIKFTVQPTLVALLEQVRYVCGLLPSVLWHKPSLRITLNPNVFSNTPTSDPFQQPS